jgi:hypothetical protein
MQLIPQARVVLECLIADEWFLEATREHAWLRKREAQDECRSILGAAVKFLVKHKLIGPIDVGERTIQYGITDKGRRLILNKMGGGNV